MRPTTDSWYTWIRPATAIPISTIVTSVPDVSWTLLTWRLRYTQRPPRLFAIATQTPKAEQEGKAIDDFTAYDGGDPAVPYSLVNDKATAGLCSKPTERYYKNATNEPMILMGYTEQQLILAEGVVRGWINGDDKTYYESAVKASFEFYRTYATDVAAYLSEDAAETYLQGSEVVYDSTLSTEQKIERIAMQKYLPTFLQGGVWLPYYEALRTGYPDFRRASGVQLPYRWMYPQSEYNNNAANVQASFGQPIRRRRQNYRQTLVVTSNNP